MQQEHEHSAPSDALVQGERTPSGMGRYFLRRLERLVDLRRGKWGQLNPEEQKAVDWAIYSTLLDCLEFDVAQAAREVVRRHFGAPQPAGITPPHSGQERAERA
ncbi:MAG: hypothetical protein HY689_14035 [Chloroflexi bacterium]|nr:hypothetical protein [Chloroflexota bacterium]